MPRDIRRVITGHDAEGNAVVMIDETMTPDLGHVLTPQGQEKVRMSDVCLSQAVPEDNTGNDDTVEAKVTLEPPAGGGGTGKRMDVRPANFVLAHLPAGMGCARVRRLHWLPPLQSGVRVKSVLTGLDSRISNGPC